MAVVGAILQKFKQSNIVVVYVSYILLFNPNYLTSQNFEVVYIYLSVIQNHKIFHHVFGLKSIEIYQFWHAYAQLAKLKLKDLKNTKKLIFKSPPPFNNLRTIETKEKSPDSFLG